MSEIVINNLTVTYKSKKREVVAVDKLNATFLDGQINVIVGPSGCGKSTLLRTILGLNMYDGDITLDGVDILYYSTAERNFAYVSQEIVLQPHMTVFDNIAYPLKIRGMEKAEIIEKVNAIAKDLNIEECLTRRPKQISLGQAQRTAIARALVKNASFYFFDEPFSNLDSRTRDDGKRLLLSTMKKYHSSVVYVTHSIQEATALADKIFVMNEGKFIFEGTAEELYDSTDPLVSAFVDVD